MIVHLFHFTCFLLLKNHNLEIFQVNTVVRAHFTFDNVVSEALSSVSLLIISGIEDRVNKSKSYLYFVRKIVIDNMHGVRCMRGLDEALSDHSVINR